MGTSYLFRLLVTTLLIGLSTIGSAQNFIGYSSGISNGAKFLPDNKININNGGYCSSFTIGKRWKQKWELSTGFNYLMYNWHHHDPKNYWPLGSQGVTGICYYYSGQLTLRYYFGIDKRIFLSYVYAAGRFKSVYIQIYKDSLNRDINLIETRNYSVIGNSTLEAGYRFKLHEWQTLLIMLAYQSAPMFPPPISNFLDYHLNLFWLKAQINFKIKPHLSSKKQNQYTSSKD